MPPLSFDMGHVKLQSMKNMFQNQAFHAQSLEKWSLEYLAHVLAIGLLVTLSEHIQ
jgi:hypothetical protein